MIDSNFNEIIGVKIPAIIIVWDQIAYSSGDIILVRIGKEEN